MENLKMHTPDLAEENYKKLAALFPNAVTETISGYDENGKAIIERSIDADVLRQEISAQVVEGMQERYQFTWPDKKKSVILANQPIAKTLRLAREKSVGRDGKPGSIDTENIYIEGDNLDALKLLQETYLGKIKMIYIDPPYNTGSDAFVYDDKFSESAESFSEDSGQRDDDGNLLFDMRVNNESNGRFHTDWLNMLYPRLRIAKDFLRDDGVIFISIDDHEVDDLKKICMEIFGAQNFIGCAGRITKKANNQGDYWAPNFDYLLTFAKNIQCLESFFGGMNEKSYNMIETDGPRKGERYQLVRLYMSNLDPMRGCTNQRYYIECPDGSFIIPPGENFPQEVKDGAFVVPQSGKDKIWRWSYQSYLEKKDQIVLKQGKSSNVVGENGSTTTWNAFTKTYLNDVIEKSTASPNSFIEEHINQNATHELKKLDIPFAFAKPTSLIKYLAQVCRVGNDDIIMDFFSGSGTVADACMQISADGTDCHSILVQLPEKCDPDSDAYKAGYRTICEIGEERIRRAGKRIKEESPMTNSDLDIGFRVFKVDSSNMKDVYYCPSEYDRAQVEAFADNVKEDRTPEDLLFQVMLDLGILLSSKIEEIEIAGKRVFTVDDGYLIACFDRDVTDETVKAIAQQKPFYAVFRDSGMANDSVMTNFEQIFETYSPKTQRKVL